MLFVGVDDDQTQKVNNVVGLNLLVPLLLQGGASRSAAYDVNDLEICT